MKDNLDISVVIPVFNEEDSIIELNTQILNVIQENYSYELIYINDGSNDASKKYINSLINDNQNIRMISFYKNRGKSDALNAGFKVCNGNIIITIDSDLQDDPNEFIKLINKLNNGFDMVSGWKKNRKDYQRLRTITNSKS